MIGEWQTVDFGGMVTHQAIVLVDGTPVLAIRDADWGFVADIDLTATMAAPD